MRFDLPGSDRERLDLTRMIERRDRLRFSAESLELDRA
jgi:hypothetical protein